VHSAAHIALCAAWQKRCCTALLQVVHEKIKEIAEARFREAAEAVCSDPVLYGDIHGVADGSDEETRVYKDLGGYEAVLPVFAAVQEDYNRSGVASSIITLSILLNVHWRSSPTTPPDSQWQFI
jgi:hypothetical protein